MSPEIIEDLKTPVLKFLSGLEHDLTVVHGSLEKERLGTADKLFAIAGWSEDELHQLFKEALPEISIPERYILIKGLKKHGRA